MAIPQHLMVEGIRSVESFAVTNRSALLKPSEFDTTKYAAKWTFVGANAEAARLPQRVDRDFVADGWQVWKHPETKKPCIRPLGSGKQVILMCRPKHLQKAVNAIFGNTSKDRTIAEQQGKTVDGKQIPQGIIPGAALKGYDPKGDAEAEPIPYTWNSIPPQESATVGAKGRGEVRSKTQPRRKSAKTT